ncbi:MAG: 3-deoxy-manno-octulosonate cytidylyltransferase [Rhizobiaceae bacterium]|nr:3-deoxy-manno-octulosonate cytidylyltransferase [Rhizobiaceae bacterium]
MSQVKQADNTLILIPARMASTRLPDKPMADIGGVAMICQVYQRAVEANIGTPWVATDSEVIKDVIVSEGGLAVLTGTHHQSGSDRIWEAVSKIDPAGEIEFIINLQGDLPTIEGKLIAQSLQPLLTGDAEIATLGVEITSEEEKSNPNVVKIVASSISENHMRAIYFTRAPAPWGPGPLYHHIGIYAYRRAALEKFVNLPPSPLERREKLEQLRAIEAGMRIDVSIVDTLPLGVDTQEDLERAREWFSNA